LLLHFGEEPGELVAPLPPGSWRVTLDSADPRWRAANGYGAGDDAGAGSVAGGNDVAGRDRIGSEGQVTLARPARSALLLRRDREA
ncbi:MAG TPA: hypothetical protein VF832_12045, partial [Longimicrobiales bacterium]